jgi:formate-dependent nitrite reductase membrane component NrfD
MHILGEEFVVGYRQQTEWMWLIATAFFLGEIGAGVFFISYLFGFIQGLVVSLFIVLIGKTTAHLLYLGRPERFWRMFTNFQSWITRGLYAIVLFAILGGTYTLDVLGYITLSEGVLYAIGILAAILSFVVMIYDGFVMSYSPSIPLWNTTLLPVLCVTYSLLGGATLTLFMANQMGSSLSGMILLERIEISLLILNLIIICAYALTMKYSTMTARKSIDFLVKERYSIPFLGGVVVVGLIITMILAIYYTTTPLYLILVALAITELIGDYLIRILLLKSGIYAPVLSI